MCKCIRRCPIVNPVPGHSISTPYGRRGKHWTCRKDANGRGAHTGCDIAAPPGTPIVAPIAGTIRHRNYGAAFGRYQFAISPSTGQPFANGEVFFAHTMDRLPDGTEVQAGQQIARVGYEGNVVPKGPAGAHLHMEFMPVTKNIWNCSVHADPAPVINWTPSTSGGGSSDSAPYVTKDIYTDRLGFGQRDSDTVKELQRLLNGIKLVGGKNLPITGNYLDMTDAEVRKWQEQVCGDKPDPAGRSYLGPKQRARMFPSPPYVLHDKGLPAIAGTSGSNGGSGGGDVGDPAPPPVVAWFVPASLSALRDEINARWPNRDKSSDGTIGDYAHSQSKSEHNPVGHKYGPQYGTVGAVHAMDITVAGTDKQVILDSLIGDQRVWYVIHDGFIYSKNHGPWDKRPYSGSDPHTKHIHVSLAADDQEMALRNERDIETWLAVEAPEPPVTVPPGKPDPDITVPPGKDYATREELEALRQDVFAAFAMAAGSLEGGIAPAPSRATRQTSRSIAALEKFASRNWAPLTIIGAAVAIVLAFLFGS